MPYYEVLNAMDAWFEVSIAWLRVSIFLGVAGSGLVVIALYIRIIDWIKERRSRC